MKIYALGDVHGNSVAAGSLLQFQIERSGYPDLILLVGDVGANYLLAGSSPQPHEGYYLNSLKEVLSAVSGFAVPFFWVSGNHDLPPESLEKRGISLDKHLEGKNTNFQGVKFSGLGGCPEPYGFPYDWKDDWEKQTEIFPVLSGCDVLISHTPPKGLMDKTMGHDHVGSQALREALEYVNSNKIIFCGHIHEALGHTHYVNSEGVTVQVVNCGAYGEPYPEPVITVAEKKGNLWEVSQPLYYGLAI